MQAKCVIIKKKFMKILYSLSVSAIFICLMYNSYLCIQKFHQRPTYYENEDLKLKAKHLPEITICSGSKDSGLKETTLRVS